MYFISLPDVQLPYSLTKVGVESQEAGNMAHVGSTDNKRKNVPYSRRDLFKAALGHIAIGIQMIRRSTEVIMQRILEI